MHVSLRSTDRSADSKVHDENDQKTDAIISVSTPHHQLNGRISAVASSPNLVYIGTVAGDIRVIGRVNGEQIDKRWDWEQRPIEGLMFDFEGKLVYATEMNLVLIDRTLNRKLKEYRSHDPLRTPNTNHSTIAHHRSTHETKPRPH